MTGRKIAWPCSLCWGAGFFLPVGVDGLEPCMCAASVVADALFGWLHTETDGTRHHCKKRRTP